MPRKRRFVRALGITILFWEPSVHLCSTQLFGHPGNVIPRQCPAVDLDGLMILGKQGVDFDGLMFLDPDACSFMSTRPKAGGNPGKSLSGPVPVTHWVLASRWCRGPFGGLKKGWRKHRVWTPGRAAPADLMGAAFHS